MVAFIVNLSCSDSEKKPVSDNPFFASYDTPYGVPPFDKIKAEHFIPAFEKGMEESKKEVEAILSNKDEPTYENTVVALDRAGELLSKVSNVFFNLTSANTSPELQKIEMEISPKLAAHSDEINLDPRLFERLKSVYENREKFNLTDEELFLLENSYKSLIRNGAALDPEKKEELKAYNQELSVLRVKFNQNVLAETNNYKLVISRKEDLAGLPEAVIEGAAETATAGGMEGQWVFTTQKPSMIPFLQYSENRKLRSKLYNAYANRANNDNDHDNKEILARIMELRADRAELLGYPNHASLVLEPRMAGNPGNVYKLLDRLWEAGLPVAKRERGEMQKIIDRENGGFKLAASDWWYYAEKLRMEKYNLDDSELRPYFELDNVRDGAFMVANKLYGITFEEITDIPKPHPDAVAYDVKDNDGSHLGVLYLDFFPRDSKEQGAWCNSYREHRIVDGKEITPVMTMVMNFTKPSGDSPSLLSLDEVETLFHEFGHALDGLFSKTTYNTSFIAWDFVELPSQIMEHWATEPEVLRMYAHNFTNGETIPDDLIKRIGNSSFFNQGFNTVEVTAACYLDMAYHTLKAGEKVSVPEFEKEVLDSKGLIPEILPRYRSTYFLHIIGGYDSGYYSYDWAGVLDNDAFDAFREKGIFDNETAESFRKNILEKNGTMDAMQMYINFRGRKPNEDALLRNRGLL